MFCFAHAGVRKRAKWGGAGLRRCEARRRGVDGRRTLPNPGRAFPMTPSESKALAYKGFPPSHCCCDSAWRRLPGGEQGIFFLTGGNGEPEPGNFVALVRSGDEGETWGALETVITRPDGAVTLSEVVVREGVITIYVQIHDGHFGRWRTAVIRSTDNARTWSAPVEFAPVPRRSMIRNLYRASWGEWFLPYQYYEPADGETEEAPVWGASLKRPWNGVLSAPTPDGPWTDGGRIRGASGWAEVNVVELRDGRLVMLARSDGEGALLRSESADHGRTWSPYVRSGIENPGSKFRLFRLRDGRILLLHNPSGRTSHPNSKRVCLVNRNPLALWISDDDMATWGRRQVITDFPGMLAYPDGEVDEEERHLHLAFDYNRHDVIYWRVAIPAP